MRGSDKQRECESEKEKKKVRGDCQVALGVCLNVRVCVCVCLTAVKVLTSEIASEIQMCPQMLVLPLLLSWLGGKSVGRIFVHLASRAQLANRQISQASEFTIDATEIKIAKWTKKYKMKSRLQWRLNNPQIRSVPSCS